MKTYGISNPLSREEVIALHAWLVAKERIVVSLPEIYGPQSRHRTVFAAVTRLAMQDMEKYGLAVCMPSGTITSQGHRGREVWRLLA